LQIPGLIILFSPVGTFTPVGKRGTIYSRHLFSNKDVFPMAEYKPVTPEDLERHERKRGELVGKVLRLPDLVKYQEGTVASRMIISRKSGNITLISFDENEGLSEHTAPFDAMVTILDGECEVWVAGTTCRMTVGETVIFPANVPHALSAITKFKMILVMIKE
jgi:quercetin dioxygenase-like cupin family protein